MQSNRIIPLHTLTPLTMLLAMAAAANAEFVRPSLGGGTVTMEAGAPMKHADVAFHVAFMDAVEVEIDTSIQAPRLRPLPEGVSFDPLQPWSVLQGKAHNAQYGWNPSGFTVFPTGGTYWIEQTASSEGLEVYQAPPETPGYAPIFGTAGTLTRWKWSTTTMVHNYYAAEDFMSHPHWASYRVYLGHELTGDPLPGYGAAEVLFEFALPGDYDNSGVVNEVDYTLWTQQYGSIGARLAADGNADGRVDAADYTVWRDNLGTTFHSAASSVAIPEPTTAVLLLIASSVAVGRQRDRR